MEFENRGRIAKLYILNITQVKTDYMCYRVYPAESGCFEYNQIVLRILERVLFDMNTVTHIIKRPINNEMYTNFLEDYNVDAYKNFKYRKNKNEVYSVGFGVDKNLIGFMFEKEIYNSDITVYCSDEEIEIEAIKESFVCKIVVEKNEDCLNIFTNNNGVDIAEIIKISLKEFDKEFEVEQG